MTTTDTPTLDDIYTKLRAFLRTIVGDDVEVMQGLGNRVPLPAGPFVAMTAIMQLRLATNQDAYTDEPDDTVPSVPVGLRSIQQNTRIDVQLDFYGADSGNWAAMASTLLRDDYGCEMLAPAAQPLYADDAKMAPLVTGEEQYLQRWIVTATLQYNPVTTLPQQFADAAVVDLINVDERYPPT